MHCRLVCGKSEERNILLGFWSGSFSSVEKLKTGRLQLLLINPIVLKSPFCKHPKVRKNLWGFIFLLSTASSIPKFRTFKRHVLLVLSALLHLISWLLFTTPAICCKACFPRMISAQRLFLCLWHCDRGVQRVFHKQGDSAKKNLRNGIGRPDS